MNLFLSGLYRRDSSLPTYGLPSVGEFHPVKARIVRLGCFAEPTADYYNNRRRALADFVPSVAGDPQTTNPPAEKRKLHCRWRFSLRPKDFGYILQLIPRLVKRFMVPKRYSYRHYGIFLPTVRHSRGPFISLSF